MKVSTDADSTMRVTHTPDVFAAGDSSRELKGGYCILELPGGAKQTTFMSKQEIDTIRDSSRGKNQAPWTKHYPEQAKKTILRRAVKLVPLKPEAQETIAKLDANEFGRTEIDLGTVATSSGGSLNERLQERADGGAGAGGGDSVPRDDSQQTCDPEAEVGGDSPPPAADPVPPAAPPAEPEPENPF